MCPPEHFGVRYEINPWMHRDVAIDRDRAMEQWAELARALEAAGATVDVLPADPAVPDLVFTANAGIVDGHRFVPARFKFPERQGETQIDAAWFESAGWEICWLPAGIDQEGAGDALPFAAPGGRGHVLVAAHPFRSDVGAAQELTGLLGVAVRSVELVDPRLYHLDLTFCPLDGRRAICAPSGWDRDGVRAVEELVPEPLWLESAEALSFCANSVVVGSTVVMPSTPVRVGRQLESWGFDVVTVDVGEFLKAGGGCRCLTLALDVDLAADVT
jgi:N-dimethylarginine dimethylaminohydrolase